MSNQGATLATGIVHALSICAQQLAPTGWVIGGSEILKLALPWTDEVIVTHIDLECSGDAVAPVLNDSWVEATRTDHESATGINYSIITYKSYLLGE